MRALASALLDFDNPDTPAPVPQPEVVPEPEVIPPSPPRDELEAVRVQAFDDGYHHGLTAAATAQAAELATTLSAITQRFAEAEAELEKVLTEAADDIVRMIVAIIAAGFPQLSARYGEQEIAAMAQAVVTPMRNEPKIIMQVAPAMLDGVTAKLRELIEDCEGRLTVVPHPRVAVGDVKIVWDRGHALRKSADTWAAIAAVLGPVGLLPQVETAAAAAQGS